MTLNFIKLNSHPVNTLKTLGRNQLERGNQVETTELGYLKSYLLTHKSFILNKTQEFRSSTLSHQSLAGDEADVASQTITMNLFINLHERDRNALVQIDRALAKIDLGTYGLCESCGDKIEFKRLKARPFAALCIHCMEELEDPN